MARSLGQLTIDLVARTGGFIQGMDEAERSGSRWRRQVEQDMKKIGNAIKIGSAAAVAGLGAMVVQTVNSAREIQNLSRLANSTPQDFQRMSYAASRFGIEQGKVSDVLKDVNDRIGDFVQTGGGPMLDFFENIAPLVGVTADDFARLSGPEALQLYVSSLEEANVSQADFTFYMETIASDATALLPLLRNNGEEMRKLGEEAEETGNVFSDLEFQQLEEVKRGLDELTGAATGMKNEVVMAALPAINDLIDILSDPSTMESAKALGEAIITSMNFVIEAVDGAIKITQFLAEELAAFVHGPAFDDIPRLTERFDELGESIEEQQKRLERLRETPNLVPKEVIAAEENRLELLRERRKATEELIASAREAQQAGMGAGSGIDTIELPETSVGNYGSGRTGQAARDAAEAAEEEREEAAKRAADLMEDYRDLVRDLQTDEENLSEQLRERLALLDQIDEATEQDYARTAAAAFQESPDYEGLAPEIGGAFGELRKIGEAEEKLEEWYQTQLDMLRDYREERSDLTEEWNEQERRLEEEHQDRMLDIETARQQAQLAAAESLFGNLTDVTKTFAGEQSDLYKTMFAVQKAAAIAQSVVAIQQGIAMAAANPWPANLAAMASVAAATASIIGNIQSVALTGMAHDGLNSVPKTGTYLLEQGERVTTADTSAKLDRTLDGIQGSSGGGTVVNVNNAPPGTRTESRTDSEGREIVDVFIADMSTGGPMSRSLQNNYGLRRQGR